MEDGFADEEKDAFNGWFYADGRLKLRWLAAYACGHCGVRSFSDVAG
jgi:hypothetical protein